MRVAKVGQLLLNMYQPLISNNSFWDLLYSHLCDAFYFQDLLFSLHQVAVRPGNIGLVFFC